VPWWLIKGGRWCYWYFATWCLYKEAQTYFEAIVQLFTETQPIDLLTVSAQLKKNAKLDLAGRFLFDSTYPKSIFFCHIEFHSESYFKNLFNEVWSDFFNYRGSMMIRARCFDLLDKAESKLYEVTQGNIKFRNGTEFELRKKNSWRNTGQKD
jgi:replicative DNA helicase